MAGYSDTDITYTSTGSLPAADTVAQAMNEAYNLFVEDQSGELSQVYPALAAVDPTLFGISLVSCSGRMYEAGDAGTEFPIMSVAKPFVFALLCDVLGHETLRERIGVNATGRSFNSVSAIEAGNDGRTNPMVNAGAIATVSLVPGDSYEDRWQFILQGLSAFAGRPLVVMEDIYASASETNFRNRALVATLLSYSRIWGNGAEALDLYTRLCSLGVTAHDLAVMGATLADGGANPITRENIVNQRSCHYTLAVTVTAGMYETSGDWLYETGLPGKSGIGGGIVVIAPGKGGVGIYAPLLDSAGNSVKGQHVAQFLSGHLGLGLFFSER